MEPIRKANLNFICKSIHYYNIVLTEIQNTIAKHNVKFTHIKNTFKVFFINIKVDKHITLQKYATVKRKSFVIKYHLK